MSGWRQHPSHDMVARMETMDISCSKCGARMRDSAGTNHEAALDVECTGVSGGLRISAPPDPAPKPVSNVTALPGCVAPSSEPNQELVEAIEQLLEQAKAGYLKSFVGTGFVCDGGRISLWAECDQRNVYAMLGAIAWLEHEYVHRVTEPKG